jgi:hypothetical protein
MSFQFYFKVEKKFVIEPSLDNDDVFDAREEAIEACKTILSETFKRRRGEPTPRRIKSVTIVSIDMDRLLKDVEQAGLIS